MAFRLGNITIDEILYAVAQNFDDEIMYTLDQLSAATIEISSDPREIVDKNGNVVRTIYKSKTGTFNATNAFLHPAAMNATSGSEIVTGVIEDMPRVHIVPAGASIDVSDAKEGTIRVIGLFGNGANDVALDNKSVLALVSENKLTAPVAGEDLPVQYLVKYNRDAEGVKLMNTADTFPSTTRMTLYCSYVDLCEEDLKPCYVYLPSFMADPNMSISLDSESQEMDFNGTLQVDYCSGQKLLYAIYFPAEDKIKTGVLEA